MRESDKELGPLIPEIIALLGGIVCVMIIALPLNTLLGNIFGIAALIAPFVEEPCKVIGILYLALYYPSSLPDKMAGARLGALAGLGFAFVENIIYLFQAPEAVLVRAVFPVLMHICASATAGMGLVFLAQKNFDRSSLNLTRILDQLGTRNVVTFFLIAIGMHFFYNFLAMIWIFFIAALAAVVYVFYKLYSYLPDELSSMDGIGPVDLVRSSLRSESKRPVGDIISDMVGSSSGVGTKKGSRGINNKGNGSFCSNCGTKVADGVKFCPVCGSRLK